MLTEHAHTMEIFPLFYSIPLHCSIPFFDDHPKTDNNKHPKSDDEKISLFVLVDPILDD